MIADVETYGGVMRVLQRDEVMAVAGGMVQCEPDPAANPHVVDYGCVDNFLGYMFEEFVALFQWWGC